MSEDGRFVFAGPRVGATQVKVWDLEHFRTLSETRGYACATGTRQFQHTSAKLRGLVSVRFRNFSICQIWLEIS